MLVRKSPLLLFFWSHVTKNEIYNTLNINTLQIRYICYACYALKCLFVCAKNIFWLSYKSRMGVGNIAADCHIVGIAIIMSCLVVGMGIPIVKA